MYIVYGIYIIIVLVIYLDINLMLLINVLLFSTHFKNIN